MVEKEINLKNFWFHHKSYNFYFCFLECFKLSLSSKYASQCFQHLHSCHKLIGIQNLIHYFSITGCLMKSWARGLHGHSIWSACSSKVMIHDQPQSPAGVLLCLNTHSRSPCRAQLPSTSSMPCWRGPRSHCHTPLAVNHLPGSCWSTPSSKQLMLVWLWKKMDVSGRTVKKVGYSLIRASISLWYVNTSKQREKKKREKSISAISSFSYSPTQKSEIKPPSD